MLRYGLASRPVSSASDHARCSFSNKPPSERQSHQPYSSPSFPASPLMHLQLKRVKLVCREASRHSQEWLNTSPSLSRPMAQAQQPRPPIPHPLMRSNAMMEANRRGARFSSSGNTCPCSNSSSSSSKRPRPLLIIHCTLPLNRRSSCSNNRRSRVKPSLPCGSRITLRPACRCTRRR